ncbi:unnamed protein product [Ranitomeya imitator]|uniref:Uncharacterized protein n=1 Tax=Ranitomeya imitator TaxID=111125 RepID=A0ABN9L297_9NEOB|nr:unnamed protein product [Ranitomeya imitator]
MLNLLIPSSYQPPKTYHPVETYIDFVQKDVKTMLGSIERGQLRIKHKFTNEEYRSLQLLQLKKELVIKPADKGGSIVILDKAYFMEEIYTQLIHIYRYRTFQPFDIEKEIKKLVTHYQQLGTIDKKLGEFLIKKHPVIPVFYTLPKIHKDLQKPPGHPIVASTNSILSPLAITLEKCCLLWFPSLSLI